jgi:hypothetical protein
MTPPLVRLVAAMASGGVALLPRGLRKAHGTEIRDCVRRSVVDAWAGDGLRRAVAVAVAQSADLLRTAAGERRVPLPVVRTRLAPAAVVALLALLLSWPRPAAYYDELVVSAVDPAGPFSLTIREGRLVAGTLSGEPLPPHRLQQSGRDLRIIAEDGSLLLALTFDPPGTVRWEARSP